MKSYKSKKYRDNLAKELKKIRKINKKKAIDFLSSVKKTNQYKKARKILIKKRKK